LAPIPSRVSSQSFFIFFADCGITLTSALIKVNPVPVLVSVGRYLGGTEVIETNFDTKRSHGIFFPNNCFAANFSYFWTGWSRLARTVVQSRLSLVLPPPLEGDVPDHSTFSKNRHGGLRDSDLLRHLFESVLARCIAEGLVGGESFGADASIIRAEASPHNKTAFSDWSAPDEVTRATREYLDTLDYAAFGATTPVRPKSLSPCDPAADRQARVGGFDHVGHAGNRLGRQIAHDNNVAGSDLMSRILASHPGATSTMNAPFRR
jgi:hypothetical protein